MSQSQTTLKSDQQANSKHKHNTVIPSSTTVKKISSIHITIVSLDFKLANMSEETYKALEHA